MKLVKENIHFERGLSPKKAMKIGDPIAQEIEHKEKILKALEKKGLEIINFLSDPATHKTHNVGTFAYYALKNDLDKIERETLDTIKYIDFLKDKLKKQNESINFERGLDPRDAMNTGNAPIRFATYMIEKENRLKKEKGGPIWKWWESYSGDFWEDLNLNNQKEDLSDFESWKRAFEKDEKRALIQKGVINKLLIIEEMPDDIDKWLWPGKNKRAFESINFERGLNPKDAMNIGDAETRLKEKYHPKFRQVFYDLMKKYTLRKSTYSESIIKQGYDLKHVEAECRGRKRDDPEMKKGYIYFLGYNIQIKKYYTGYATDIDVDMPIDQEIDEDFEIICACLDTYIQKNEEER